MMRMLGSRRGLRRVLAIIGVMIIWERRKGFLTVAAIIAAIVAIIAVFVLLILLVGIGVFEV